MIKTKRTIVTDAYSEIGLASYIFDLDPEAMDRARRRLDAMVANLNARGANFPYPLSSDGDLDEEIDVPDYTYEYLITNLAIALAPGHGKVVPDELRGAARRSKNAIATKLAIIPTKKLSPMVAGAGNKQWFSGSSPYITDSTDNDLP